MDDKRVFDMLLELGAVFNNIEPLLINVIGNLRLIKDGEEAKAHLDINGCIIKLEEIVKKIHKWEKFQTDDLIYLRDKLVDIKEIIERLLP